MTFPQCWRLDGISPMNRTVDRVPKRAETDWLRLLGDTGIDLDREAAPLRCARHFNLDDGELDRHGMLRQFIQGTAIAASAAVLMPHRMTFPGAVVASLGLEGSEQPVWLFDDAEHRLGRLAADRAATITGVAAAGWTLPYYPPQLFVGRETPGDGWETVATGRMALTSHGVAYDGNGVGHRETAGQFVGAGMDLHNICTKTAQ